MKAAFAETDQLKVRKISRLLPLLLVGFSSLLAGQLSAQSFKTLHNFAGLSFGWVEVLDGAAPQAALILSGNALYGTALDVFKVNTDGTSFLPLYIFLWDDQGDLTGLTLSGNTLFGMTHNQGSYGTVFAISTDGTGFTTLYSFSGNDGANPVGGLTLSDGVLYGTTYVGGNFESGTVFKVNTDGTGFSLLHSFTVANNNINSDGYLLAAGLVLSNNTLYGTAYFGGSWGSGTIFSVGTDGTGFRTLHSFTGAGGGANPVADLTLSDNILYGTTVHGGSNGSGTVFKINIDGTGFRVLHEFSAGTSNTYTNSDGAFPEAPLIVSSNIVFGTASGGGNAGNGTLFSMNIDGTGFTIQHVFTATAIDSDTNSTSFGQATNSDGISPAGLTLSGNTLYGTASFGGIWGWGTVFSISLPINPPQLTVTQSAPHLILTWPTNAIGFALQSTTNLVSPQIWTAVSTVPVVANGRNAVTNRMSSAQEFFRLSQ
jgi:uncharacterized repeat protein (TIGR03803 family)